MKIFNLPNDIFPGNYVEKDSIIIYDYTAQMESLKGKSVLNKNAISLVVSGQKTMHFAQKTVNANDNEIHFLSAGNCIASIGLSGQTFRSILIFFDDNVLNSFFIKNDRQIQKFEAKHEANAESYISIKKDDFILHFISSLELLLKNGKQISQEMKTLKFEELLQYLLETYPHELLLFQGSLTKNNSDLEIRKVVELNMHNKLSVEELAFLCNMSISTFKRRFERIYNTSPNNWFLQQKMKMAETLLRNYLERPGEIFHKIGYENHSSFTKSFKKIYGVTPKKFQGRILNV
jgi:AraC family transcriptional regulator, exoenzyme S synthesis regulatory protein ExsA